MNIHLPTALTYSILWLAIASEGWAQTVAFPDPNLEAAVRQALSKPTGDITVADMLSVTSLQADGRNIHNLTGLDTALNLEFLDVAWNPIHNHSVISALTNLVDLSLAATGVTNLDFLAPLLKLQHLNLYDAYVPDVSPLLWRTNLRSLHLGWCGATNAPALSALTGLEKLWLGGIPLTNAPWLASLTNLTELGLDYTELADMSPVTNLTKLSSLNVGENHLTGYPDLSPLANLVVFMTAGNAIADLSPLTNLPALRNLHLQRNVFQDISPLTNCVLLDTLLLSGNSITNLNAIVALTNLWSLELRSMALASLDLVLPLTELRWLDAGDNLIKDLSSLTNLPWLDSLGAEKNRLQRIGPLLDMPSAHNFNLRNNYLDTNATSEAWNVITNLLARGFNVEYDPQLPPPAPIHIFAQPANRSAFIGNNVAISVSVTGGTPAASFRWQKDSVDLADDSRIHGADTDTLQIDNVSVADSGLYRVRVWDEWMETNSAAAELKVITTVAFADPNLEQAVRDGLNIPTDPLTPEDFMGITYLTVSWRDITNLSGLEAAVDLEELDLGGNFAIQSFAPLSFLSHLNNLHVYECRLDDLSFVELLPSLTALEATRNFIEDLSPLNLRPGLQHLDLWENELTRIEPLLDLLALVQVRLPYNRLDTNATSAAWNVITNLIARGVSVEYAPQRAAPIRPTIITQPTDRAAFVGDNVQFQVAAAGGGTLHYQWSKDGVNLFNRPGLGGAEGDTLGVDNVQPADAGSYRVRVWDENGVTNSRTVTLRVVTNVTFVDPQLELAVRDRLGIPSAPLTPADLATMDGLDAYNYGITNLSGIEAAANLYWLVLGANPGIMDYSPLNSLYGLRELYLHYCGLTDIPFVTGLPLLRNLDLAGNIFTDLSPVTSQLELRWLSVGDNVAVTNFQVIAALTNLEDLGIQVSGLDNLAFASSLPNLRNLDCWGDAVADLAPLAGATNLQHLELNGNQVTNAAPLGSCTNLEWLSIGNNPLHDLSFVTNLTRLAELYVRNLGVSNLTYLAPLTNLLKYGASGNGITNLPAYAHLNQLRHLDLDENPLANIAFASGMTNLEDFYISRTGVKNLSPLNGRTNLLELALAGNGISDVSPLATLPFLRWVGLWDNHLQNISAFSGLTNLNYLELRHNWLDITPGSAAMTVIATLQGRGTTVDYIPQDEAPATITLSAPRWLGGNQFRFTITSAPGAVLQIWRSTNLNSWLSAGFVTNTTGTTNFTDNAATDTRLFYRAQQQ